MNIKSNKQIAKIFRDFADKTENGTCGVDAETLTTAANMMIHIKLNAEQMCTYLNCSRATLTRMITDNRIPKPKKESGGKEYWYQDEVDEHIERYKAKYHIK